MQSINNKASELRIFKLPNARRLKMLDGTIGRMIMDMVPKISNGHRMEQYLVVSFNLFHSFSL